MTHLSKWAVHFALFSGVFIYPGCAKVGDPLPPIVQIPDTPASVELIQIGDESVVVSFPAPPADVNSVALFRQCQDMESSEFERINDLTSDNLVLLPQEELRGIRDPSPTFSSVCTYRLRFKSRQGQNSDFSTDVETSLIPVMKAPGIPSYRVEEDAIVLEWEPPTGETEAIAYLVNSSIMVTGTEYRDTEIEFGKEKTYSIQAIAKLSSPTILSAPGEVLKVTPRDIFEPASPANLTAVSLRDAVQLIWDQNQESDLEGYFVYRRTESGDFIRISSLIKTNRYLDRDLSVGTLVYYGITAVDRYGNESVRSDEVAASIER